MLTQLDRLTYSIRQSARVAWFMGHYFAARDFHRSRPPGREHLRPTGRVPSQARLIDDMAALFHRDLANVAAGHYPLPSDDEGGMVEMLRRSRLFFADLPGATERRREGRGAEIVVAEQTGQYPDYYLQNFHYQTGGYLTEDSADLYDMQVEVLFSGTANAMRRQCLVPLAEFMRGRDQRELSLLDVACGTGRFLRFVKEAYPRLPVTGVDLSEAYLKEAKAHLGRYAKVTTMHANAECLSVEDASRDIVVSIFLFHELPPEARAAAAAEFARVLKPGGRLIFMDSLQTGDVPGYDGLLEMFPVNFHEPYFEDYLADDLRGLFERNGLTVTRVEPVFLSKLIVADKPC